MDSSWLLLAAKSPLGRICLHVVAMSRDHHIKWHSAGIWRELREVARPGA